MIIKSAISLTLLFTFSLFVSAQWLQEDIDIDGKGAGDEFGWAIDMPDKRNLVVGSPKNNANGVDNGLVRVYRSFGGTWLRIGQDIEGDSLYENFGWSVSMPDSNTFAAGSPTLGTLSGKVKIYSWSVNNWVLKGNPITTNVSYARFGHSIDMPDNNTIVIGAPNGIPSSPNEPGAGFIEVYRWDGNNWIQKGNSILADTTQGNSLFGYSVSMPDSNTVAVGAPFHTSIGNPNTGGGLMAGNTKIFKWNGNSWVQKGQNILGFRVLNRSGESINMPDSNTIAIGEPSYPSQVSGAVVLTRVFVWNGTNWVQKGNNLLGNNSNRKNFGISVHMFNRDYFTVGTISNQTYSYKWDGIRWIQFGNSIVGENPADSSGWAVCMPDTNYIGIGAPRNDGNGNNSGQVRVFNFNLSTGLSESKNVDAFSTYPNPVKETLIVETSNSIGEIAQITSITGAVLFELTITKEKEIIDLSAFQTGLYFLRIANQTRKIIVKN